jgi:ribulose-phosphate 3-epimerase
VSGAESVSGGDSVSGDAGSDGRMRREASSRDAPSTARARVAASILDADLGNLAYAVKRAEREGADRIHLDVMDGHFVPNLTFGAKTIAALRKRTRLPFDAHLMIANPGKFMTEFLDAGCDSVTIHVEIEEDIEPTLRQIRAAGRAAGLCVKPKTPLAALEPYRRLLDIVMVMTVEPGFGGQSFMADVAKAKLLQARDYLSHKLHGGEVHVDGGINRETAELVGGLGVDILVVGSALWEKERNMAREIRLIRALADEGYQYTLNDGVPPIPRDKMVTFATLRRPQARTLRGEVEAAGIPVLLFRSRDDPAEMDDETRRWDLLIPASAEAAAKERFSRRRAALARVGTPRAATSAAARA